MKFLFTSFVSFFFTFILLHFLAYLLLRELQFLFFFGWYNMNKSVISKWKLSEPVFTLSQFLLAIVTDQLIWLWEGGQKEFDLRAPAEWKKS